MKKYFFIALPILLVLFFCCAQKENENIIGSYQSVSESEWDLTLVLLEKGQAEIIFESWEPGQYEKRNVEKESARWSHVKDKIIVYYAEKSDTLLYFPKLSLSEIGKSGDAPGLLQSKPDYRGRFNNVSLWKLPHNF